MKIGLLCQNYPPATFEGGISHYSRFLAEGLAGRGHRVSAVASTEFATPPPEPSAGQVAAVERVLLQGPWGCATVAQIRAVARAKQWDAVILQFSPASFRPSFRLAWALTPFDGQKLTAFHTLWGGGFDRLLGLLTLWGSGKIIATNSEVMYLIERYTPLFLRKTYWVPIGSNILPPLRPEPPPAPPPVISYFGMLYPGKGLHLILDCLQALQAEGYGFRFKFIGGGMLGHQRYEADFRKGIAERHLQGQVEHLGLLPAERVSSWISRSRFIFLPYEKGVSDRRGTLMAALAHGKAILTSPPAVEMPFLQNGRHLCWPEENTVPGYLARMKALLTDDGLVARLEEGAKGLATNFTWDRIVSDYERVLEQP